MKNKILLISLIFLFAYLTTQNQIFRRHYQTTRYNQTAYTNQMLKRQQQFDQKIKAIQQQVQDLDKNISQFEGNDTYQIMKLQEGLADQRDSLYDVQNALNKPFALKPCQKPNLTDQQKLKLNNQIKATNQSLHAMRLQVKKCTDQSIQKCSVPDQLIHQITRAELYLDVMNDYVNGNCTRVPRVIPPEEALGLVDLNNRLYKDNLKAPNWIYGNITQQQYRLIVFAQTTKNNMTTCPLQTPFANKVNNTCFNCPQGSIFSIGERVCTCKKGFRFDQSTNECVSQVPIKPCNETGNCVSMCPKDKPKWNSVNKLCQSCPADKPIVNRTSNTCQSCPQQKPLWNQITYQCQQCPLNTHYVQNLSKCVPCKDDEKFNQTLHKCVPICKENYIYNKQQGKCYSLQQLNGCKCNQKYNEVTKQCQDACQNGLQWLSSQRKCGPPSLPDFKDNCKYYQRLNKETNQCQNYCDSTVAWYDRQNHVCIKIGCSVQCKCGEIFDTLTGKCIPQSHQCPPKQYFNTTTKQCQLYCSQGLFFNPVTNNCQSAPLNCLEDQRYDSSSKKCVKKCTGSFQSYSFNTKRCQCTDGYHFDSTMTNCVQNPISCDASSKLIYSKQQNKCVCIEGYTFNTQNICVSICASQTNMVYSYQLKRCVCKQDYYPSPDGKYCLHISSKCLAANNMVYNQLQKNCQCVSGYQMNSDASSCISLASTCLSQNNQHYDPLTMSCVCNDGFILNQNDRKCYANVIKCNSALHFILNTQTQQCECISGYRLSTDRTTCISLAQICLRNPNTVFNSVSARCQCLPGYQLFSQSGDNLVCNPRCKQDQNFNFNTQQCVKLCPFDYYYNTTTHSCIYRCQAEYQYNNATQQCQRIIKTCPDPVNQFYDSKTNQCHYCPAGYTLNTVTLMCEKKTISCASDQFYDQVTSTCKYCRSGQVYNVLKKVCQYLTTNCSAGMYFDFSIGQCRTCLSGFIYDQSLLECRKNCTVDQLFDYGKKICVQIASTCNQYQYYDQVTRKCVNKPICSSLQRYDQTTRKCVQIIFITAKNRTNLIHSNFTAYEQFYDARKATDKYLRDCPDATPFYSSSIKNCVYCPITHPYFNLQTQKCQDCGNDKYDNNKKICVNLAAPTNTTANLPNIDYSLDRLVMNII